MEREKEDSLVVLSVRVEPWLKEFVKRKLTKKMGRRTISHVVRELILIEYEGMYGTREEAGGNTKISA